MYRCWAETFENLGIKFVYYSAKVSIFKINLPITYLYNKLHNNKKLPTDRARQIRFKFECRK